MWFWTESSDVIGSERLYIPHSPGLVQQEIRAYSHRRVIFLHAQSQKNCRVFDCVTGLNSLLCISLFPLDPCE